MKKKMFSCQLLILTILSGLIFSGCEEIESGEGTIRLMNNSTNVIIVYCAVENSFGRIIEESHININPGASVGTIINTGIYTIYLEDQHGDGWETKSNVILHKDRTVEVRFPTDFKVAN